MDQHDDIGERIKNQFTRGNNILVIVDDVWKKSMLVIAELAKVGIYFGGEDKKKDAKY